MSAAILVPLPLLVMAAVVLLAVLEARDRKKAKVPLWRAVAAFARRHDLAVQECLSAPYGVPEAFGDVGGRPFYLWVVPGKSSRPIRTAMAVATRFPHRAEVYVTRGDVSPWVLGMPWWKEAFLGEPPKEHQVRITSPSPRAVVRLKARLDAEGVSRLRRLVDSEGFFALAFRFGKAELRTEFLLQDPEALERLAADLLAAAEAAESCVDPDARGRLTRVRPRRTWHSRWTDTGIMLSLLGMAGLLAFFPLLEGGTWELWAFLEGTALLLAALAGSRIWASCLRTEERAILAEFAGPS